MSNRLDSTNRKLIGYLRHDGRASITTLAAELGLSRATVQARLGQMIREGTIRRFTVELSAPETDDKIHAVMMVELQGNLARSVIARMKKMPQIASLHTTNGAWDLVAQIEVGSLTEFDQTLRAVREISGVSNSETCLLLDRER